MYSLRKVSKSVCRTEKFLYKHVRRRDERGVDKNANPPPPHYGVLCKVDDFVLRKWPPGESKNSDKTFPTTDLVTLTSGNNA
jgi:hypothetical protein